MEFIKKHKNILATILLVSIGIYLWFTFTTNHQPAKPNKEPITIGQTTEIAVVPKTSLTDNDLEIKQVYKAEVNGATVEIPVETKENTKAVVKQEINLTKVLDLQREKDKAEFKKNWEVGVGVGIHEGDIYIPVEAQRNYAVDKAVSVEIHLKPAIQPKVTGGEIKHKWLF